MTTILLSPSVHRLDWPGSVGAAALFFLLVGYGASSHAWTVVVTNSGDPPVGACATTGTGSCTLREAIVYANANRSGGGNRIEFLVGGGGGQTILLTPALPSVLVPIAPATLTIDGGTQTGYADSPLITLRYSSATPTGTGLAIAGDTTIKGLAFGNFSTAVTVTGSGNTLYGNYFGVATADGLTSTPNRVNVSVSGTSNRIGGLGTNQRNIISGTGVSGGTYGIQITGPTNTVQGNYIGTDASGMTVVGNNYEGAMVQSNGNTIDSNVIAGNNAVTAASAQLSVTGDGNTVTRNLIGTNALGVASLSSNRPGPGLSVRGNNNQVGTGAGDGNLISGNGAEGVYVYSFVATTGNRIVGNRVGTDTSGSYAIPNANGVSLLNFANGTVIKNNIISGNTNSGISLQGTVSGAVIQGNSIGVAADGSTALPNGYGIAIFQSSVNHLIGGTSLGEGNVIAMHSSYGVLLYADAVNGISILGNSIYRNGSGGIAGTTGSNHTQTKPVLTSVNASGIVGTLDSVAGEVFRIEYFSTPIRADGTADPAAGKSFLGFQSVSTDGAGHAALALSAALPPATSITATATRLSTGDTSRFADPGRFNTAPQADGQSLNTAAGASLNITLTGSDPDPADALSFSIATGPNHGSLSAFDPATGVVIYTPAPGFSGSDNFTFTVSDGTATSESATVQISVQAAPGPGPGPGPAGGIPIPSLGLGALLALGVLLASMARWLLRPLNRPGISGGSNL